MHASIRLLMLLALSATGAITAVSGGLGPADRGAAILAPFKQQLMGALKGAMQESVVSAIEVCQVRAPEIAASLSLDGVAVGRTSHRLRNPANASPDWAAPVLREFLEQPGARLPTVVELAPDRYGYVEPIVTQPLCLACHGATLAPAVADAIAARYPQDRATGFSVGDLRGVFWAEFPAQPAAPE
jgi:hypothetical protein